VFSILVPNKYRPNINDQTSYSTHNGNISDVSSNRSDILANNVYSRHIPCPTNLRIEKQLSNSIMIAWNPPLITNNQQLHLMSYQILLDHNLYSTIHPNEKTRALIENINLNEMHRISVRTLTQFGSSRDQECTLLINGIPAGNNNSEQILSYAPSELKVDRISQTSAVVSWWPASNNLAHKLLVNDIEVQTLKPNVHRFKLSGLLPDSVHKVTIKAKLPSHHSKQSQQQQQLSTSTEFKTLAFVLLIDESIEPPKRVQIIAGPQADTLLVSWVQSTSLSNTLRGYRIMIDGRKLVDVLNPLSDHSVLHINSLNLARLLSVRCITDEGESRDSVPVLLTDILTKLDMDTSLTSTITDDKDNDGIQTASTLTLHSDDESNSNVPVLPTIPSSRAVEPKPFIENVKIPATIPRSFDTLPSTNHRQIAAIKPDENGISASLPSPANIKPDKIRPIIKEKLSRPLPTLSSPSSIQPKLSDVPQIEINSPSPSSPRKSREEHFGYDEYVQQTSPEEILPVTRISKSSNKQQQQQPQPRKIKENRSASSSSSAASVRQPLSQQQRDHSDPRSSDGRRSVSVENEQRRTTRSSSSTSTITPNTDKALKYNSPRHASSSSDDQQTSKITSPTIRTAHIKEENNEIVNRKTTQQQQQQKPSSVFDKIKMSVNHRPRLFIALFTYDPNLMSPNKDNDEELPFSEGQLIKIYGDQDADGFYVGETPNGRTGYVPGNMVTELQVEDAEIEAQLLREQFGETNQHNHTTAPVPSLTTTSAPQSLTNKAYLKNSVSTAPVKKMIAVYDYNAHELSPNADPDEELSFKSGDIIYVHGNVLDDGYFMGEMKGVRGLVPSNFLQEVTNDPTSVPQQQEDVITSEIKKSSPYRR
ncbi:unnamed protein product, partial [Didymodactylos carnosus]